jgi:hypothetical protein
LAQQKLFLLLISGHTKKKKKVKLSRNISIHHVLFIVREANQDEVKIFEAF